MDADHACTPRGAFLFSTGTRHGSLTSAQATHKSEYVGRGCDGKGRA